MQDNQYKEVIIVLIACTVLFLLLSAIILLFFYMYQRRRFVQQREMAELKQQLTEQSLKAQLEIQEQTFQAISQEIHDNVGQVLSLAKVQINIMRERDSLDASLMEDIRDNIGKAMADLRDLARSLSSEQIQSGNFQEMLAQEIGRVGKLGIIRAEMRSEGEMREIDPRKKLILFRIVQECIQNCIKHAEATTITVSCFYQNEHIQISIKDDGKGFDHEKVLLEGGGMGLGNIRTRVFLTGGTTQIESAPSQGTDIILRIPYE